MMFYKNKISFEKKRNFHIIFLHKTKKMKKHLKKKIMTMFNFIWLDIDSSWQTSDSKWLDRFCDSTLTQPSHDSTRKKFRWLWLEGFVPRLVTRPHHWLQGETLSDNLQVLKTLAKECTFSEVTVATYREELTRDAFIIGLSSTSIRQRLLEKAEITLVQAFELAESLDRTHRQSTFVFDHLRPATWCSRWAPERIV